MEPTSVIVIKVNICPECETIQSEQPMRLTQEQMDKVLEQNTSETLFLSSPSSGGKYRWLNYGKKCRAC